MSRKRVKGKNHYDEEKKTFCGTVQRGASVSAPVCVKTEEEESGLLQGKEMEMSSSKDEELPDDEDALSDEDVQVVAGGFLFFSFRFVRFRRKEGVRWKKEKQNFWKY